MRFRLSARSTAVRSRNEDIYVVNADGSQVRQLTRSQTTEALPVWQPVPG